MGDTVLAILAHPDDAEFLCAGTLIRLGTERGWKVHVATMTAGDCGSAEHAPDEIARIRRAEGAAAAAAVGATYHCLEELDLRVVFGERPMEKVCRLLNAVRPRVVITHSPEDYHLDHEQTSHVVRAAAFAAPIPNFLHRPGHAEPHPPLDHIPHLYYCDPLEGKDQFGRPIPPAFRIDVTRRSRARRGCWPVTRASGRGCASTTGSITWSSRCGSGRRRAAGTPAWPTPRASASTSGTATRRGTSWRSCSGRCRLFSIQ